MKLSEVKEALAQISAVEFSLPDGQLVPVHFHVTEIGQITKRFIDCGGTVRSEKKVSFQLWEASDFDHRLAPEKLKKIIALSESVLSLEDAEVEVEYQSDTIGKYGLEFSQGKFQLTSLQTACLASDQCGITEVKEQKTKSATSCCTPGGGCC